MIVCSKKKIWIAAALAVVLGALLLLISNACFENQIDQKLQNIVHPKDSSISLSSRAEDYIKASYSDYQYIIGHGERSLNVLLRRFALNEESGLEQYIMALACSDILKEKCPVRSWISGRDWYNQYMAYQK